MSSLPEFPSKETGMLRRLLARKFLHLGVLAFALLAGVFNAAAQSGPLDGTVFLVEAGEKGKAASEKDVLIFHNGRFLSTRCQKWFGFDGGTYLAHPSEDAVSFVAETESNKRGNIQWEGTVRGMAIEVRFFWTEPTRWYRFRSEPKEFWARSISSWAEVPNPLPSGIPTSHLLDGKTFFVKAGAKDKPADHGDYLIFREGKFISSGCVEIDFGISAYTASPEEDGIRFHAEARSPTQGIMIWDGRVRGEKAAATARWLHQRWLWKIDREYWYEGSLLR